MSPLVTPTPFIPIVWQPGGVPTVFLDANALTLIFGVAFMALVSYFPMLDVRWQALTKAQKLQARTVAGVVIVAGLVGLHAAGAVHLSGYGAVSTWDMGTLWQVLMAWGAFIGGSEGGYTLARLLQGSGKL